MHPKIAGLPSFQEIEKRLGTKPFQKAINRLRMIGEENSPMDKINLLNDVNLLIF